MLMKYSLLLMAFLGVSGGANASGFCERTPVDPEFPAGLNGGYEITGRDPLTGAGYTGTLVLGYGKDSYALTRTVRGKILEGDAWIEMCGMDKIRSLIVRYHSRPVTEMVCILNADGGNYYRASCKTRQGGHKGHGLEAWFQKP